TSARGDADGAKYRGVGRGTSQPRDDPARERLGHAPFLIHADGEHQFLKALTLELADLLDQRLGRADQAGGADEAGVDQLGFPRVQIGAVARLASPPRARSSASRSDAGFR